MNPGTTERIDAHAEIGTTNCIHVEHITQIADVGVEIVMAVGRRGAQRFFDGHPKHALQTVFEKRIGLCFDPVSDASTRRAAVGRIVFDATILRRVVRRRDDDAIRKPGNAATVEGKNRMRNYRGGGVFILCCDHDLHAICRQHFDCTGIRRSGQRMRVDAEEQWTINALRVAVQAYRLDDRQYVPLVEAILQR